jgi:putative transposase
MIVRLPSPFWIRTSHVKALIRNGVRTSAISGLPRAGSVYLVIVLDLYPRRIVGWKTSDRLKKWLALKALSQAILMRQPPIALIHHADRGSQYCSVDYSRLLQSNSLTAPMSGKGNCYDKAIVETVFKTIKSELIWTASYDTRSQATLALGQIHRRLL